MTGFAVKLSCDALAGWIRPGGMRVTEMVPCDLKNSCIAPREERSAPNIVRATLKRLRAGEPTAIKSHLLHEPRSGFQCETPTSVFSDEHTSGRFLTRQARPEQLLSVARIIEPGAETRPAIAQIQLASFCFGSSSNFAFSFVRRKVGGTAQNKLRC